jgi:hypothetical protein
MKNCFPLSSRAVNYQLQNGAPGVAGLNMFEHAERPGDNSNLDCSYFNEAVALIELSIKSSKTEYTYPLFCISIAIVFR